MKNLILVSIVMFASVNVFAKALPVKWGAPEIAIQTMTCEEVQDYAKEYGHYWKQVNTDDIVPIYPIDLDKTANCKGGKGKSKMKDKRYEYVKDHEKCFVTYYCQ